ncbi:hypothetical protein [Pseudoalteromonas sp. BDTF-M6]|uniref:hypothetical protein n=1 Tax=Pseudoalteromonas sp. BDTF-M6 TaxID=2796132 RepID=UPI001BAF1C7E|nr:hypothetical protein [Pseudoalteromonas sp. BDTF-M6]MBS3796595.1 hypothetical protein [Pseudoalteromonas sp. BDTF-M6]
MKNALLIVSLVFVLCACSKPIPREKADYIGYWRGGNMELTIHPDGSFTYEREEGNTSTSINAPLQKFEGDDFVVGIGFFNTRFEVSQAPHQVNGQWQMVVDGVLLTKKM